jgi:hypothetical protein
MLSNKCRSENVSAEISHLIYAVQAINSPFRALLNIATYHIKDYISTQSMYVPGFDSLRCKNS